MMKTFAFYSGPSVLLAFMALPGFGQQTKRLEQMTLTVPGTDSHVDFIRLPAAGDIAPVVTGKQDQQSGFNTVASYLGKNELSFATVKATLSESSWTRYVDRVMSLMGNDDKWDYYREAARNGSSEYPATSLSLVEIMEICRSLQAKARPSESEDYDSELEDLLFRLPSRMEWQFAARAATGDDDRESRIHFYRWAEFSQRLQGQIEDLQTKVGDNPDASKVAGQSQFVNLIERALQRDSTRKEAANILGEVLQASLGFESNIGKSEQAKIFPVTSETPNPWGFHRIIGNAPEWVITVGTRDQAQKLWDELSEKDLSDGSTLGSMGEKDFGVLMGGHFFPMNARPGIWAEFSIEIGFPNLDAIEPEPYLVKECFGEGAVGVEDGRGGMRLLMRRSINPNWLVSFRKRTFLASAKAAEVDHLTQKTLDRMKELLPSDKYDEYQSILKFYQILTTSDKELGNEDWQSVLSQIQWLGNEISDSAGPPSTAAANMAALLALTGDSSKGNEKAKETELQRGEFFEISLQLAAAEIEGK